MGSFCSLSYPSAWSPPGRTVICVISRERRAQIKFSQRAIIQMLWGGASLGWNPASPILFLFLHPRSPKPAVWITCKQSQNSFHASQEATGSSHASGWCTKNIFPGLFLRPCRLLTTGGERAPHCVQGKGAKFMVRWALGSVKELDLKPHILLSDHRYGSLCKATVQVQPCPSPATLPDRQDPSLQTGSAVCNLSTLDILWTTGTEASAKRGHWVLLPHVWTVIYNFQSIFTPITFSDPHDMPAKRVLSFPFHGLGK